MTGLGRKHTGRKGSEQQNGQLKKRPETTLKGKSGDGSKSGGRDSVRKSGKGTLGKK